MQNHSTWYIPWGANTSVQKMLPLPLNSGYPPPTTLPAAPTHTPSFPNYPPQFYALHQLGMEYPQQQIGQINPYNNNPSIIQQNNSNQQNALLSNATQFQQNQIKSNLVNQNSVLSHTTQNYNHQNAIHPISSHNLPQQNYILHNSMSQQPANIGQKAIAPCNQIQSNLSHQQYPFHASSLTQPTKYQNPLEENNFSQQQFSQQTLNAAAMFTPLTLQTFITNTSDATTNHLGYTNNNQKTLTPTNYGLPTATATIPGSNALEFHHQTNVPQHQSLNVTNPSKFFGLNFMYNNGIKNSGNVAVKTGASVDKDKLKLSNPEKRKLEDHDISKDLKKAKLETKALKAKRPGFTDERYHETSYYMEHGLRKVYPYYFTFTTFTKGRWVGEKILDVFAREFRAHPAEEYERCINAGTLTVNYDKVPIDYRLKHNDLLANIVHRHEVPVTSQPIKIIHMDDDIVVVNKPASIPVHPCGRYRHNTVVFIMAKEYNLKNLRTIHRLDRLTSGLLLFGRNPKKARQMEHQIRNRQVQKTYVCRVVGEFPNGVIECQESIEVVSYKIGVCKVSPKGKDCSTTFEKLSYNGKTSVVVCKPKTGRMHQIRVHLQYLGYPIINDPLYNHVVFGPNRGRGGDMGGKSDDELIKDLITIHNAENWLGIDGDSDLPLFKPLKSESIDGESRESSPYIESSRTASIGSESPVESQASINLNSIGLQTTNEKIADTQEATVSTQTGHEAPDKMYNTEKLTTDKHCYECKVRYRDPKSQDLVMYLHALTYKGPEWGYETELPAWAANDFVEDAIE